MPPKKGNKCSCRSHDTLSTAESPVLNIGTCKKYRKCALNYLIEEGLLENYSKYLCDGCYQHGLINATTPKLSFSEFCVKIENNDLCDGDFFTLCKSFAKVLKIKLSGTKHDYGLQTLQNPNFDQVLASVEPGVRQFLLELCDCNTGKNMSVINAYENLVQLANPKFIGPLNFARTIISYFISGSRRIVELNATFSPSGSYATVLDFLKVKATKDHMVPPTADCIYVFDNNQIMARSWKVQFNSKPLISVVTTLAYLVPPTLSNLQTCDNFMPCNWLSLHGLNAAENIPDTSSCFRGERNNFIEKEMQKLSVGEGCPPPTKSRKVEFKSGKAKSKSPDPNDPYADIDSFVSGKTEVKVLDPVLVNPCSFQSLEVVLDTIVSNSNKSWVVVVCDGLPYSLCSKIIENYFRCPHCEGNFQKRQHFENHIACENLDLNINECKKYKNILLIPGFGHIDINITRAIFKLMWKVCIKDLALLLGWKSLKALTACESCTDHHKATQILDILFESLKTELLHPYINDCEIKKETPSTEKLYDYVAKQNNNYIFLFKCAFTYLYSLKMFKKGMRRANYKYMKMAMDKLSPLFYGFNMTTYMDLWFRFETTMLQAPPEVKDFLMQNICMSQSGHQSKAEGGDFILETTNKKIKSYMPHGVPTDDRWTRICRSLDNIEQIKRALHSKDDSADSDESKPNKYFRKFSAPDAVVEYSRKLRAYLSIEGHHTSTDNKQFDHDLVNFDLKCEANKSKYYENYPNVLRICERVFVTPEDRSNHFDISQKTKDEIKKIVNNLLKDIDDAGAQEEAAVLRQQWCNDLKSSKKSVLLTFYREVVQCLQDVTSRNAALESEMEEEEESLKPL